MIFLRTIPNFKLMKKINKLFLALFTGTVISLSADAQGFDALLNPKVSVMLIHPPGLGIKVNKVVFNPVAGYYSDQITDEIINDFIKNGVDVLDRGNLQSILSTHNISLYGYMDRNTAISIGKILGPSAMITLKVLRNQTEQNDNLYKDNKRKDNKTKKEYTVREFIAKTTVFIRVSVQTTDLTTGRIFSERILDYSPSLENRSERGRPELPSKIAVQDIALKKLVFDVRKMFFPWEERCDLYFMDDKEGGLKDAYKALNAGYIDEAFDLSKKNLEFIKSNPQFKDKILAHAYYNMGMMYFIKNMYDQAIINFKESQRIRPGSIVSESINECNRANALAIEMQRVDEKASIEVAQNNKQILKEAINQAANTMTNADVITLTKQKLGTKLIIQKINTSVCKFNTSTEELVKLSNAGVAEEVILLMMEKK